MENSPIILRIYDEVGGDAAVSVTDGDLIFQKIDKAFSNNLKVTLDFQNIDLIITAFLNACIGQLYSKYTSEELNQNLKLENVKDEDKYLFSKAIKRAKEYFENPESFDNSVNEVLGDD
ncbi:MAG: STAS-like domain-containing protein [Bacteroidales bacterium]|nr:STAS-like domain-containing protein [Bacteroidales bacterium]